MIRLEHRFEQQGPLSVGCYDAELPSGRKFTIHGRQASLLSLLLSGYQLRDDLDILGLFREESLAPGRAYTKVVKSDDREDPVEAVANPARVKA